MLEAKNVVKTFDGFRALDGATLTAPAGAVYGLVGPNGAGKSTLIRHLTGVYRPDSGELLLVELYFGVNVLINCLKIRLI